MKTLTTVEKFFKTLLALFLIVAGSAHFLITEEYYSLVPMWIPADPESVVLISGVIEITLGGMLLFWGKKSVALGLITATYFALIFPGNVTQYVQQKDALGLNTDELRMIRLFLQPIFIVWAVWATGAWDYILHKKGHWHEKEYDQRIEDMNDHDHGHPKAS